MAHASSPVDFRQDLLAKVAQARQDKAPAIKGDKGWLFYLSDVQYVTGDGFLQAHHASPLKAIIHFQQQLAARGIQLIVLPVPVKTTIYPEKASALYDGKPTVPQNPSYTEFVSALHAAGVTLFDPTAILLQAKHAANGTDAQLQYMPTDTHWTFNGMELVAQRLADFIKAQSDTANAHPVSYTRQPVQVSNISDIVYMMKLPRQQKEYPWQQAIVQQVQTPDGQLWQPTRNADILVLGDSFSNIYSYGGAWGQAAGLAEQLSYYLQRPVDRLAIDGGAANETRLELRRSSLQGRDRLLGKRLVIYEFSVRYLLHNDWKLIDLPLTRIAKKSGRNAAKSKRRRTL